MIVNVKGKALAVGLVWQEAKRSDLPLLYKSLQAKDGIYLSANNIVGISRDRVRGSYALAPIVAKAIGTGVCAVKLPVDTSNCYLIIVAKDGCIVPSAQYGNTHIHSDLLISDKELTKLQELCTEPRIIDGSSDEFNKVISVNSHKRFKIKARQSHKPLVVIIIIALVLGFFALWYHNLLNSEARNARNKLNQIHALNKSMQGELALEHRIEGVRVLSQFIDIEKRLPMFAHNFVFKSATFNPKTNRLRVTYWLLVLGNIDKVSDLEKTIKDNGFKRAYTNVSAKKQPPVISMMLSLANLPVKQDTAVIKKPTLLAFIGRAQQTHLHFIAGKTMKQGIFKQTPIAFKNISATGLNEVLILTKAYRAFSINEIKLTASGFVPQSGAVTLGAQSSQKLSYNIQGVINHV